MSVKEVEEDEVVEVVEEMEARAGRAGWAGWGILAAVGLCGVFVGGGVGWCWCVCVCVCVRYVGSGFTIGRYFGSEIWQTKDCASRELKTAPFRKS